MNINLMIFVVIVFCIISVGAYIAYQNLTIKNYKQKYGILEHEIKDLQIQAEVESKHYLDAKKKADEEMKSIKNKSKNIINSKVPKNCNDAITWGIKQAENL